MTPRKQLKVLVLLGSLLLMLTACGGAAEEAPAVLEEAAESEPGPEAGAIVGRTVPDACTLLTNEEIVAVTGGLEPLSVNGGVDEDGLFASCTWVFAENGVGSLSLNLWSSGEAGPGWGSMFLEIQMSGYDADSDGPTTVEGLGDEAFLAGSNDSYGLWWRQGNDIVAGLTALSLPIDPNGMVQLGQAVNDFQ